MTEIAVYSGGIVKISASEISELSRQLGGDLLRPVDDDYDEARVVWNAVADKRPALIARCEDQADVVVAVKFARARELLVSVRCGGHNVAGKAVAENGLMIDLTPLCGVTVDPESRTVVVGGGAALGDLDRATQAHGLATTAGVVTHTGVGGLTLGGGVGRLARKYGLACDNLISVDLVTADGEELKASAEEHSDLFWALRGGGGNFGIVTSFTFRLHEIGTQTLYAAATHPIDEAREALAFLMEFAPSAPREVTSSAVLSTLEDGTRAVTIAACHIGPLDGARAVLEPLIRFGSPLVTRLEERPYLEVQSDADLRFPYGQNYYWKTHLIKELPETALETLVDCLRAVPNERSMIVLQQFGGAVRDVAPSATAFANRDAEFDFIPAAIWQEGETPKPLVRWARDTWLAFKPYSAGVYLNSLGAEDDRLDEAVGANVARLRDIKRRYDPDNFFRLNANIEPAAA
jgi:FAD/FMN-containing dehydrogenase